MGRKKHTAEGDAAMTFADIGKAMGITRGDAWMAYRSALRKLRRNPQRLAALNEQRRREVIYPEPVE